MLSAFRKADAPDEKQLGAYLPVLLRMTPDAPAGMPDPAVVRAEAVLRLVTLTADAIRGRMTPTARAALARTAAQTTEALRPGLLRNRRRWTRWVCSAAVAMYLPVEC